MSDTASVDLNIDNSGFMLKVFYVFATLALLSVGLSVAGKWLGASISMAGHTDDTTLREIVIGNNVIVAPANTIRFERQRLGGIVPRLDLYLRWPQLDGYSKAASGDFNNVDGARNIVFVTLEPRQMSRDMSGRFDPIYSLLIEPIAKPGPAKLALHDFSQKSGYMNEQLAVGPRSGDEAPYVARCLTGTAADESLAPCERDIQIGDELSVTYRFPAKLLPQWKQLDEAIVSKAKSMLRR